MDGSTNDRNEIILGETINVFLAYCETIFMKIIIYQFGLKLRESYHFKALKAVQLTIPLVNMFRKNVLLISQMSL